MSSYIQTNQPVQLVAAGAPATYSVSSVDNGKLLFIPVLGGAGVNTLAVTLPPLQIGLHYRFIVQGALGSAVTFTPNVAANIIIGVVNNNNVGVPASVVKTGFANIILTATAASSDYIDFYCDGTNWHISGTSRVAAGFA